MNDDNKKKLHEHFENQGITQIQIAKDLNVTKNYINMLFTGRRYFGRKTAQRFEDLYGISYAWLMTGEGNMLKSDIYNNVLSTGGTIQPTEKDNVIYALQQLIHCKNAIIEELKKKLIWHEIN